MVDEAILNADVLIVLCGTDTAKSVEVNREITIAQEAAVEILQVLLQPKVVLPSQLDWKIQGIPLDNLFSYRRVAFAVRAATVSILLVATAAAIYLWAGRRIDAARKAEDEWHANVAQQAGVALRANNPDLALVLAIAAYPDDDAAPVPEAIPEWLVRQFVDVGAERQLNLTGPDSEDAPPLIMGGMDSLIRIHRRNGPVIALDCSNLPDFCDWGPGASSSDERYVAIADKVGHLVLFDLERLDPALLGAEPYKGQGNSPLKSEFPWSDKGEPGYSGKGYSGIRKSFVDNKTKGVINIQFDPCRDELPPGSADDDDADKPNACKITSVAFLNDEVIVGFDDGSVYGLGLDGVVRWRATQSSCKSLPRDAGGFGCAIRDMQSIDGQVFGSIDDGAVVKINADGGIEEAKRTVEAREVTLIDPRGPALWHRSDYCLDEGRGDGVSTLAASECQAVKSWSEGQAYFALDVAGNWRSWGTQGALRMTNLVSGGDTDSPAPPFFSDPLPSGDGIPEMDAASAIRLTDDLVEFRTELGRWPGVAIYSRKAKAIVERVDGKFSVSYRGEFYIIDQNDVIRTLVTPAGLAADRLPDRKLKESACHALAADPIRRSDLARALMGVRDLFTNHVYPCGLTPRN